MALSSFLSWILFMNFILYTNAATGTVCLPGNYCSGTGVSINYPCPIGTYGNGLTINKPCPVCPSGTYTSTNGTSSCSSCQAGGYSSLRIITGNSTAPNMVSGNNTGLITTSSVITAITTGTGAIIHTGAIVNTGTTVTGIVSDNPAQSYLNQNRVSITNTITNNGGALITIVANSNIAISATSNSSINVNIVSNGVTVSSGTTTNTNGVYNSITGSVTGNGQTNNMITTTVAIAGPITITTTVTITGPVVGGIIVTITGPDTCFPCQPGTYSNPGGGYCIPCPAGTYSGLGFPTCTACPTGTSSTSGSSKCALPLLTTDNQFTLCVEGSTRLICAHTPTTSNQGLVPVDYYSPDNTGNKWGQFIFNFTMANFPPQSSFGSITTIPTITPLIFTDNTQCISFYLVNNGSPGVPPRATSQSLCNNIALPYQLGNNFLVSVGSLQGTFGYLVSVNNFLNVVAVTDPNTSSFSRIYIQCNPGYGMSASNINCQQCVSGTYSPSLSGQSTCMACPAGSYCDGLGLTIPTPCPSGTRSASGAVFCSPICSFGYYPGSNQACLPVVAVQSTPTSTINQFYICATLNGNVYCLGETDGPNYAFPTFQSSQSSWTLYSIVNNVLVSLSNPTWFVCMYGIWSQSATDVPLLNNNGNYCGVVYAQWRLNPYNNQLLLLNIYNNALIQLTQRTTSYCGTPPCINVEPYPTGSDSYTFLQCQPGYGAVSVGNSYQCQVCPVRTYWVKGQSYCQSCASAITSGSTSCADSVSGVLPPLTNLMCYSGFCQGLNSNGAPTCYGRTDNCLWGQNDCTIDNDCLKYNAASPSYTDGQTCAQIVANSGFSLIYWGFASCLRPRPIFCSVWKTCLNLNGQNLPVCYGSSSGCLWNSNDCNTDDDCSKYTAASQQYTDGTTCSNLLSVSTNVGPNQWTLPPCPCNSPTSFQLCTDSTKKDCITAMSIAPPSSSNYMWMRFSNQDAGTCFTTLNQNLDTKQASIVMEINNNWILAPYSTSLLTTTNPGYYGSSSSYLWNFQGSNTLLGISTSGNSPSKIVSTGLNDGNGIAVIFGSTQQCASNYGSTTPCCGQAGGTVNSQYICPSSAPTCVNYIYGIQWGSCTQQCAASYNGGKSSSPTCCGQPGGTITNPNWICPSSAPTCINFIPGNQWGMCISERGVSEVQPVYIPICGSGYYWDNIVLSCVQKIVPSVSCSPGYGIVVSDSSQQCQQCVPGTYYVKTESTCQFCPRNTYSNIYGATSCITCPYGTYSYDGSPCEYCPPGSGPLSPNGCQLSPPGTIGIGMQKALESNTAGTLLNPASETIQFITTPNVYSCLASSVASPCPAGTFYKDSSDPNTCLSCPAGTYCQYQGTNVDNVLPCPPNTFSTNGSIACSQSCTPPDSYTCAYFYNNDIQWCPGGVVCVYPSSSSSPAFVDTPGGISTIAIASAAGFTPLAYYSIRLARLTNVIYQTPDTTLRSAFQQAIRLVNKNRVEPLQGETTVRGGYTAAQPVRTTNLMTQAQQQQQVLRQRVADRIAQRRIAIEELQRTQAEAQSRATENPQIEATTTANEERVAAEEIIGNLRFQVRNNNNDLETLITENEVVDEEAVVAANDGISIVAASAADSATIMAAVEGGASADAMNFLVGTMGQISVGGEVGDVPGIVFLGIE
jgi:hypothetical protein